VVLVEDRRASRCRSAAHSAGQLDQPVEEGRTIEARRRLGHALEALQLLPRAFSTSSHVRLGDPLVELAISAAPSRLRRALLDRPHLLAQQVPC
jgi:hypothetical protein